jgi:hypothetical protein
VDTEEGKKLMIAADMNELAYEPQSAPSLFKMEKQFRQSALKKGQDPDIWVTELETTE